jgi:hypothetical protein
MLSFGLYSDSVLKQGTSDRGSAVDVAGSAAAHATKSDATEEGICFYIL